MSSSLGTTFGPSWTSVFSLLAVFTQLRPAVSLNIDTQYPVHFAYPEKLNASDSPHFGHSVLILGDSKNTRLNFLIGAPNDNFIQLHAGSIYRCTWEQSTDKSTCRRVPVSFGTNTDQTPTRDMHLGFNLLAQPNLTSNYLSCAFSRTNPASSDKGEALLHPNGACYQLKVDQPNPLSVIMPMNDESLQYLEQANSTAKRTVYYYSHAMAGFSAAFSEYENRLLLGAPGFENWKGILIEAFHRRSGVYDTSRKFLHNMASTSPLIEEFSYLGYSLAIGRFFNDRKVEYAVLGAPRVAFVGSVAFFRLNRKPVENSPEEPRLILSGIQSGEYFGSSLLVVDLNNDGLDDLLVGAPMYCSFRKGFSDEGRVFVYISNGNNFVQQTTLYGLALSDARFGTSMASLGDINHDDFPDVVIGAPYEDDGRGAIYIYRGDRNGIASNFSQRISASELPSHRFTGFGYSFSGQADVDANGFPDLLVGSYLSNNAVLLRSRPIIALQAYMKLSDTTIDLNQTCSRLTRAQSRLVPDSTSCLGLQFCFNTANFDFSYNATLRTTLLLDSATSNERCYVLLNNTMRTSIHDSVIVRRDQKTICSPQYTILMKESSKIDNYLDPIVFSLSYKLAHDRLHRSNIYQVPIVEGAMTNITTEVYLKMCGSTAKNCRSNLQLRPSLLLNDDEEVNLSTGTIEIIEGLHRKVKLQVLTLNLGDPAFDAKVNLTINASLPLISLDSRCQLVVNESAATGNTTSIECTLESPLYGQASIDLVFNPFETFKPVNFKVAIRAANKLHESSHLVEVFSMIRVKQAGIALKVNERPPLIRYKSESGNVSFASILEVQRLNYSTIDLLELLFLYPGHSRHLLSTPLLITNLNDRIPLECEPEKNYYFAPMMSTEESLSQSSRLMNGKALSLTCANSQTACRAIRCRLGPITSQSLSSYLKLSSHLMVDTLDIHYGHYMYEQIHFTLQVIATIVDDNIASISGDSSTILKNVQFTFRPVEPISDEPVPKWPYIVGALIGLFIILLLILLLWKCGFFKRGTAKLEEEPEGEDGDGGDVQG